MKNIVLSLELIALLACATKPVNQTTTYNPTSSRPQNISAEIPDYTVSMGSFGTEDDLQTHIYLRGKSLKDFYQITGHHARGGFGLITLRRFEADCEATVYFNEQGDPEIQPSDGCTPIVTDSDISEALFYLEMALTKSRE